MSELTEDERRFLVGVFDSMLIHQQAHAMWGYVVPEPSGTEDCPACGLTLKEMAGSLRAGHYSCAYAGSLRMAERAVRGE